MEYHSTVQTIKDLLERHGVEYKCFEHEPVRTSEEAAAIRPEYSIQQGTKSLIVRAKGRDGSKYFIQVVVPGDQRFDPKKVCQALDIKDTRFATEIEVGEVTGGILPGGVPPFGNLFGLSVYLDKKVLENDEIIFNAGDKRFSIAMKSVDYVKVVEPQIVDIV